MKTIVVWYNPNKKEVYYKVVYNIVSKYEKGFINRYGHIVLLVIDIYKELIYKEPLRNKVIKKFISFLHKFEKKY